MKINSVIKEANDVADKYKLQLVEIDNTENIISMKLVIDKELFIQIYGNAKKDKLNFTLFSKGKGYTVMTQRGGNTIVILLITPTIIYLQMKRNPYKSLLKNL